MLDLLIITAIIVFVVDLSGIILVLKKKLWKTLYGIIPFKEDWSLKPFDCSLCMTFWIGLIYLIITGSFTIPFIGYVCLLSFLTPVIQEILLITKDLLIRFTKML